MECNHDDGAVTMTLVTNGLGSFADAINFIMQQVVHSRYSRTRTSLYLRVLVTFDFFLCLRWVFCNLLSC